MNRHIQIHLCLNDPSNGSPSGHALGLAIIDASGDTALHLDTESMDTGPVCRIDTRLSRVKLGHFWFDIKGHRQWAGSWCWDAVWLEPSTAADLLNKARASGWWTPDSGWSTYWERWDSNEPFTASFFTAEALLASVGLA